MGNDSGSTHGQPCPNDDRARLHRSLSAPHRHAHPHRQPPARAIRSDVTPANSLIRAAQGTDSNVRPKAATDAAKLMQVVEMTPRGAPALADAPVALAQAARCFGDHAKGANASLSGVSAKWLA